MMVQQLIEALTPTIKDVASEHGSEYQTVRTWKAGSRTPSDDACIKLAEIAEDRAALLFRLAAQVRARVEEGEHG